MDEKIDWQGTLVAIQPRIRLTRSFDGSLIGSTASSSRPTS